MTSSDRDVADHLRNEAGLPARLLSNGARITAPCQARPEATAPAIGHRSRFEIVPR